MLPPGSGKRSEQDWQGLSHARLRSILAAEVADLGSNAVAPFWFTTTSVASTPSKAWIEVGGAAKAVVTKRSGDVDMPEATLLSEWAGPGRKIRERGFIAVDENASVPDWDNKNKRSPEGHPDVESSTGYKIKDRGFITVDERASVPNWNNKKRSSASHPAVEPGTGHEVLHPFTPYWSGEAQLGKRDALPAVYLPSKPKRDLNRRMLPAGDGGGEPVGSVLPPSSTSPTTTTSVAPKATATSASADQKKKEEDEVANRGAAICGDGSEDPDYGDSGFE
jgi:hypothetical protein